MKKFLRSLLALFISTILFLGTTGTALQTEASAKATSLYLKNEIISVQYGQKFVDPWVQVKDKDGNRLQELEANVTVSRIVFVTRDSEGKIVEESPAEKVDTTCVGEWQVTYVLEKLNVTRTVYVNEIQWTSMTDKQRLRTWRALSKEAQDKVPQKYKDMIYYDFCREQAGALTDSVPSSSSSGGSSSSDASSSSGGSGSSGSSGGNTGSTNNNVTDIGNSTQTNPGSSVEIGGNNSIGNGTQTNPGSSTEIGS